MADRIQGLSIGLGMQSAEVSRSMSEIKRSFRGLNSEAKVTSNNFKYGARDAKSYKQTIDSLSDTTEKQRKNVEALGDRYKQTVEEQGASSKAAQTLATEYNKQADNLNRLEDQLGSVQKEFDEFNEAQRIAESRWTKAGESMDKFGEKAQKVGRGMRDVGMKMSMAVTAPILGFAAAAIKTGVDFDDSMAKVAAVSGATGSDLDALRQKAKDMGESTRFSASEAAEGLNYMALAGWSTEEMLGGLDGVMSLAAASGEDLGAVSDIVTDSLSAFGLEAKDSGYFADVLAQTSANANTDVTGLGNAFKYVAPVAGALGYTVEDTAKAIGLMSDSGIKGEKAGTALRTMMTNLAKPTKAMQNEMDNLGISLTNADGSMKTFDEIMVDLRSSFSGLNEEQQASAAATIFGKEAMSGALAVINTTGESFDGLGNKIADSEGAAQKMAETMEGKLGGTWRKIKSGIEGFSISIYETMLPTLEKMSEKVLQGIEWLNNLSPKMKMLGVVVGGVAAAMGPLLIVGGSVLMFLGGIAKTLAPVMTSIAKAGGLIKWLAPLFGALTSPITLTIGAIAALGIGFTVAYKKSETFRNFIGGIGEKIRNAMTWLNGFKDGIIGLFKDDGMEGMDILTSIGLSQGMAQRLWDITGYFIEFKWKVIGIVDNVKTTIKGIFAIFKGNHTSANEILQSIGLSENTISMIFLAVERVKSAFRTTKEYITIALSAIGTFLRAKIAEIVAFWRSDGQQILQATKNIFSGVSSAISGAINFIVPIIRTGLNVAWSIFKFVWPAILGLIKMVWGNIKGVINGGLKFIQGLIQVFSGIFTGDFRKMWEGVKNIFSGAIQFVWNLFQLMFWGRIIKGITAFIRGGLSLFRNFGSQTGKVFTNMWQRTVQIFKNLWTGSRNIFNNLKDGITSRVSNLRRSVVDGFNWMKNKSVDKFKALVQGAKDMMTNVGKWIDRKKQAVVNKATSLGTGIANAAIKGFNKLIGGINSVGKMLGINELLDKIPLIGSGGGGSRRGSGGYAPARYSTGTNYHKGGAAIVGDKGPGNGGGTSEIVSLPNGRNWLFNKETLIDDMPIGSKVLNNKKVEKKFGIGAGGAGSGTDKSSKNSWLSSAKDWVSDKTSGIVGGISGAFNNVKGFVSDVWDYMKNPGELASKLVSNLNLGFNLPSTALDLAKGGVKKLTSHIGKFFGGWFDSAGGEVDGGSILNRRITAGFGRYPAAIARALGLTKHYGVDTAHKYEPLTSPVTGRVTRVWHDKYGGNAIQIKSGKANWWFMHMQSIARQVGDMVKAGATRLGITGNTGLRTTGYHLHTQKMVGGIGNRYAVDPMPDLKKANSHLYGGRTLTDGLFNLHGGEYIINPNKPTEAMKLLALAGQELNGKSKQTKELPNVGGSGGNETVEALMQLIDATLEQNKTLKAILKKDNNVYMDSEKIGGMLDEKDAINAAIRF